VLIDLLTSADITGRAYLFAFTRANLKPIAALVEAMGEMIAGDLLAPFDLEKKLRQKHTLLGVHNMVLFAMAGIDMAAWDAYAQILHQPLVRVLGGTPRPVRAYNSKGLGIMPLKPLANEAEALVKEGFSAVKLRLGRADAKDDLAAVRAVKKAVGPKVTLMCDFNQALTVNEAIRRGHMLDDEGGLCWIEEPTRADDFRGNGRIADELETPVQIGENFMGPEQMAQALDAGACDYVMPDAQRIGGVTGWMRAAALATPVQIGENFMGPEQMAQALAAGASDYVMPDAQRIGGVTGWMRAAALAQGAGLEMSSHLFPEVSCHLLAVTPTCHWLEYVDWAAPILAEPLVVKDSHVLTPSAPGTGMHWDEKAVKRYLA
jgi:mandelate racemase